MKAFAGKPTEAFLYFCINAIQKKLKASGFTNISTKILYDIVWGWTYEGEVDSVSIDGNTDFEKGDAFSKDAPIIITYHMKEEDDPQKSAEEAESMETEENLTVDNCQDLKNLLAVQDPLDSSIGGFASKYSGKVIEFDGRIDYCAKYENYNTRFDYLVSAGDYDPNHQIGPTFKFENVSYSDLHTNLDTVSVGLNAHIVAKVGLYDSGSGLFFLDPVSVTGR